MVNEEKTISSNPLIGLNRATNIDGLKPPNFEFRPLWIFDVTP